MAEFRLWVKFVLFGSSYTPLFILIIFNILSHLEKSTSKVTINNFFLTINTESIYIFILIIIILSSNLFLFFMIRSSKKRIQVREIELESYDEFNELFLEYFFTYILPLIGFEILTIWDVFSSIFILFIIFITFIKSNLLYLNFLLLAFNYRFYLISDKHNNKFIVISKKKAFIVGDTITIKNISGNFYIQGGS